VSKGFLLRHFLEQGSTFERLLIVLARVVERNFDSDVYFKLRPDVKNSGLSAAAHFLVFGHREPLSSSVRNLAPWVGKDWPDRDKTWNVLFVHDLSNTGAPLVALEIARELSKKGPLWVVCPRSGPLRPLFAALANKLTVLSDGANSHSDFSFGLTRLKISNLVLNSVESCEMITIKPENVGSLVVLVHEFAYYTPNLSRKIGILTQAQLTVFSSNLALDSFRRAGFAPVGKSTTKVLRQPLVSAFLSNTSAGTTPREKVDKKSGPRLILGAGYVQHRKGVDLFIEACRQIEFTDPGRFDFAWMGSGFSSIDVTLGAYLVEQVRVSKLSRFEFMDHGDFRSKLGETAALLSTSRSDPFPNVNLDALAAGVPVFCFDDVNGTAELLRDMGLQDWIVPFADTKAMALTVVRELNKGESAVSQTIPALDQYLPSTQEYVASITSQK